MPRGKRNTERACRIQLFVEQRRHHAEHHDIHGGIVLSNGQCQRMQQHFRGPSGDGEPGSAQYGDGLRLAHLLPRRKRNTERAYRIQLFVEQRRNYAEHHGFRGGILVGNGKCQRLQQHFSGPSSSGESLAL